MTIIFYTAGHDTLPSSVLVRGAIMKQIGAVEAKTKLSHLLDLVEAGEEILITRRGKPVARLVSHTAPAAVEFDRQQARAAAERIRLRAAALKLGKFDWEEWKVYRDEGRK